MGLYRIADLVVRLCPQHDLLRRRAAKFAISSADRIDIDLSNIDEYLAKKAASSEQMTAEQNELFWTGNRFAWQLCHFGATVIHASALVIDGEAILFSADSGVGKSTHTRRWLSLFGERAYILDDDRPVIREKNGALMAYGTPFSGTSDENRNAAVPLKAIVFLNRGERNRIRPADPSETIARMIRYCGYSRNDEKMAAKLAVYDTIVRRVPIWSLECTISDEAVQLVYQTIKEDA